MRTRMITCAAGAAMLALLTAACGSGYDNGPAPTGTGVSEATITIAAGGVVTPSAVTISSGNHVTFVNNDTESHTMSSNPHPVHTDCPALNVGALAPGQSRATGDLTARRACGFHDHEHPDTASLKGTVTVN